ncbi:nuclear receptor-interacting protein 2 isoform X3 [Tursiops truncatus]|uniref:nuclear receptor-interacting protein 2 isoform X3 n=1 Tax=Tursiops truncatus TaxID=9739 RepID=UPI003CCEFA2C
MSVRPDAPREEGDAGDRGQEAELRGRASSQQRQRRQATRFLHKDSADLLPLDGLKRLGTSKDWVRSHWDRTFGAPPPHPRQNTRASHGFCLGVGLLRAPLLPAATAQRDPEASGGGEPEPASGGAPLGAGRDPRPGDQEEDQQDREASSSGQLQVPGPGSSGGCGHGHPLQSDLRWMPQPPGMWRVLNSALACRLCSLSSAALTWSIACCG